MKRIDKVGVLGCVTAFGLTGMVAGCASSPPLATTKSSAGIHAAEAVGAQKVPEASLHLQLAKEAEAQAKDLSEQGEREQALSMLKRAEADAELAILLSKEDAEKTEAQEAIARVRELRQDNQ